MSKIYYTVTNLDGPQTNYRFEKKYQVPKSQLLQYQLNIAAHGFMLHHQPRYINNLYIDNIRLDSFHENIEGLSDRKKTRFRWYGEKFGTHKITAEIKIKADDVNRKISESLIKYTLTRLEDIPSLYNKLRDDLPEHYNYKLFDYSPSLLNRYLREYFYHPVSNVRITLDHDRWYYNPRTGKEAVDEKNIIIEIKSSSDNPFCEIEFPMLLDKSSKYCTGIELTT